MTSFQSFIRFAASLPNELWQADTTHWQLADGSGVEMLNCLDDHSRLLVVADAYVTVKAADVVTSLSTAWGPGRSTASPQPS